MIDFFIFFLSIFGLLISSSYGLDSAEKIGKSFGLSPLIIGVIFIGFGTSLPELVVSQIASFHGKPFISLGNILGSNISNMALILGVSSLLSVIHIGESNQRTQIFMMLFLSILISLNYYLRGTFDLLLAIVLLSIFVLYLYYLVTNDEHCEDCEEIQINSFKEWGTLIFSFSLMFVSGNYLVQSIDSIGLKFGLSPYVISAIGLALGTSAPELFTALTAIIKKKDINLIFGNIMGSNIFNIALVLGSTSFYNFSVKQGAFDFDFMMIIVVGSYLLMQSFLRGKLSKVSGIVLLICYGACVQNWLSSSY